MKDRLHIVSLVDDLCFGGDGTRLLTFARTIDESRFDHTVVTINSADDEHDQRYGSMRQQFIDEGVRVEDLGEGHSKSRPTSLRPDEMVRTALVFIRIVRKVCRLIRERDIDVVSACHLAPSVVGVLAAKLMRVRATVTLYFVEGWKPATLFVPGQLTLGMADALITDSEVRRGDIERWMFRRNPKISVIPSGITPPSCSTPAVELRRSFGLPEDLKVPVIGQVSRLIPSKGHMVLLDAARLVLECHPNTAFLFVGYDSTDAVNDDTGKPKLTYKQSLEQRAIELGIADHVRVISHPGAIGEAWKVIDIHAHASLFDSLPNSIIEGMSLGKPAVVTSVGGVQEMVEHDLTGLVVPPDDATAMSEALIRLLREPETAQGLGTAARARYRSRYQPETMTRQLEALFCELGNGRLGEVVE